MNLQGRHLSLGLRGEDVLLLKIELVLLGSERPSNFPITALTTRGARGQSPAADVFDAATDKAVREVQARCNLPQTGIVDEATAACINAELERSDRYAVFGRVYDPDGQPLTEVRVELLERDLPSLEQNGPRIVGKTETTALGYFIRYSLKQFADAEAQPAAPDLQIRLPEVTHDGTPQGEPYTSTIHYNAPHVLTADLRLSAVQARQARRGQRSEFESYLDRTKAAAGNVPPRAWTDADVDFLSGETDIPAEHLRYLQLDAQWGHEHDVDQAVFYGLLRQDLPATYRRLLAEKPSRWREALKTSIEQNLVPARLANNLDNHLERLQELAVEAAFEQDGETITPPLGVVLGTAGDLGKEQQAQVVRFALRYQDTGEQDFWEKLQEDTGLDEKTIGTVRFTLQSSPLLYDHVPTLKAIQQRRQQEGWAATKDLARLTRDDWRMLVANDHLPQGFDDHETYAEAIALRVEQTLPTAVLAHRLSEDNELGSRDLTQFLATNPDFNVLHTGIDDFLANGARLDGVDNPEALRKQLKDVQRTTRVVPRIDLKAAPRGGLYAGVRALLSNGFNSANAITRAGKAAFMNTMTPIVGDAPAELIFDNARLRTDATQILHQRLRDYLFDPLPVLPRIEPEEDAPPDWAHLFGSLSTCECEHCRSVYGPAAYLVDLLKFLDAAPSTETRTGEPTRPLEVLLGRRPDLQHILLNCPNATTPLPYIDLVNETLELAADSGLPDDWRGYQTPESDGESRAEIERRLRAEPVEHAPAYEPLAIALYPWSLPFQPDQERVWLFSEHLGVELDQIRALFNRDEDLLARDFLHLSQREWELLTQPLDDVDVRGIWGISPENLERAPIFMQHAGLSYDELEQLTERWFLSADGPADVTLELSDAADADPCDIADYRVQGLRDDAGDMDSGVLDQIHRFLRLRRKLGWSIPDLDAVLEAFGHTQINAESLRSIARVQRLATAYRMRPSSLMTADRKNRAAILGITEVELDLFANLIGANEATSLQLLERWPAVRTSGFDLRELAYILSGWDQAPAAFTPSDEQTRDFLRQLHAFVPLNESERLATADTEREIIEAVAEFQGSLGSGLPDEERASRIEAFRNRYIGELVQRFAEEAIVENLARYLELAVETVDRLVRPVVNDEGAVVSDALVAAHSMLSEPAIVDLLHFVRIEAGDSEPDVAETSVYDDVRLLLIRLDHVARLLRGLGFARRELDVIARTRAANEFLDFNHLTLDGETSTTPSDRRAAEDLFASWQALVEAAHIRRSLPNAEQDLFDFLQQAADGKYDGTDLANADTFTDLAAQTGWTPDKVAALTGPLSLAANAFQQVETYTRLHQAMQWLRRWRIEVNDLALWGDPARPIAELAGSLKDTAQARQAGDERWYEILTPISDQLREKKRDALLAYLIHTNDSFADAADVYAHYLIDVEMSSCQLTSRIKQANASIQLFVQRLLMNLEDEARLADTDTEHWQRWEWMKNYRVWEANRKVFLYPENWIEPELRDNKSPFFRELENELLQDEVKQETVERAYRNYLEKLDEVARLDVRGLYHDEDQHVLHAFARTHSEPHIYYHRRRNMNTGVWTAWEKVELNIEGDHLIPIVHNGRLLLFWPLFKEIDEGEKVVTEEKHWEISIAWSERIEEKWISRKTSPSFLKYLGPHAWSEKEFSIKARHHSAGLEITLMLNVKPSPFPITSFIFDECTRQLRIHRRSKEFWLQIHPSMIRPQATELEDQHQNATTSLIVFAGDFTEIFIEDDLLPTIYSDSEDTIVDWADWESVFARILWEESGALERSLIRRRGEIDLLQSSPSQFAITPTHQDRQFTTAHPFAFKADGRTYLVTPRDVSFEFRASGAPSGRFPTGAPLGGVGRPPGGIVGRSFTVRRYEFETFYHPYACHIVRELSRGGIDGLLDPPYGQPGHSLDRQWLQEWPADSPTIFEGYDPTHYVYRKETRKGTPYPLEDIDFTLTGAYSLYNWELFFHIPLLVADRLSKNQRFEEAHRWFHYIFDPTDISAHRAPAKYWKVKPFFEEARNPPVTIRELMRQLAAGGEEIKAQITAWREDSFNPHLIARLRTLAYMKTVVMKYLDNLIAWGDHLFQQDTIESLNEATQLYILATEILGDRAPTIRRRDTEALDFAALADRLDEFANALIDLETALPADLSGDGPPLEAPPPNLTLYFCLPPNQKLRSYWDTVADRLFKIRHCMNIEGQARRLPLFEPPIDPALLVRARAAGLDLRQALSQIGAVRLPHYRYTFLNQKALELCNEVRSLGNALLSALEKKDAEEIALLRARHEVSLLSQVRLVKDQQIREAEETLESLKAARKLAEKRFEYYSSREFMNASEIASMASLSIAHIVETIGQGYNIAAAAVHLIPQVHVQGLASGTSTGGQQVGDSLKATAETFRLIASQFSFAANLASTIGNYQRREDEWGLQTTLSETELTQIDKQIAAAEIRLAIAEQDLANHEKQTEQSREVEDSLRRKFTGQELYGWMVAQLSALHYQAYRMAYDLAKTAERAVQHELGVTASEFSHITFGHWDSLKKGLLSGERLHQEMRRLDIAYTEQNRRELEITKHISLAMLHPQQLIQLRETGSCEFRIPELLFDLDFPGQYRRRIKSVSLTIPCVTGPYTNVSAKLTLESNRYRRTSEGTESADDYPYRPGTEGDGRFVVDPVGQQSIATSSAQSDNGLFEFNFRDERYLPFEGAGAISNWRLELPSTFPQFDYDTISDVIMHMRYTARDDESLRKVVNKYVRSEINTWLESVGASSEGLHRVFSLRQEFPSQLHHFLHPEVTAEAHETRLSIDIRHFPYFLRDRQIDLEIQQAHVVMKPKEKGHTRHFAEVTLDFARAGEPEMPTSAVSEDLAWGGLPVATFPSDSSAALSGSPIGDWALRLDSSEVPNELAIDVDGRRRLNPEAVEDIFLVLRYKVGR